MGVTCRHCNYEHYWLENKQAYEYNVVAHKRVRHRHAALNLPYRYWFVAMHLLTATKSSFSAAELQRQLGHKRYQPIWEMVNKLRDVMGKRDDEYTAREPSSWTTPSFSRNIHFKRGTNR